MCYLDRGGESAAPSHRERPGQFVALSSGSWGIGDVEVRNLPATMQEDHEHVEHSEGRSRDDEEIDRDEVGEVISEERAPSLRGRLRPTRHEPGNGALRDVEPSLSNSPWMRGAPQSGFASVMVRTRSAISDAMGGRPVRPWRDFQVQKTRKPCRCQRITVSGRTRCSASRHPAHRLESHTQRRRSRRPNRGRFDPWRSRASCCRSARFSSVRLVRVLSAARRAPNRASTMDIALYGSHALRQSSSLEVEFWQTTGEAVRDLGQDRASLRLLGEQHRRRRLQLHQHPAARGRGGTLGRGGAAPG